MVPKCGFRLLTLNLRVCQNPTRWLADDKDSRTADLAPGLGDAATIDSPADEFVLHVLKAANRRQSRTPTSSVIRRISISWLTRISADLGFRAGRRRVRCFMQLAARASAQVLP